MCIFSKLSQTVLLPIGTKGALLRCESQGLPTLVEKISGPTGQPCGGGGCIETRTMIVVVT